MIAKASRQGLPFRIRVRLKVRDGGMHAARVTTQILVEHFRRLQISGMTAAVIT